MQIAYQLYTNQNSISFIPSLDLPHTNFKIMKAIRILQLAVPIIIYSMIYACTQNKEKPLLQAPLFEKMGGISFDISTSSETVQRFFNQGLALSYGLNHAEAFRSFEEGARLDENCAMCYWGMAYVLGRNINSDMDVSILNDANQAIEKAVELIDNCSERERSLILALTKRYPKNSNEDLAQYNESYAQAMQEVNEQFEDDDIATLYGESLMNIHPWDYWENDGSQKPWTAEILVTFQKVLANNPGHIGSNHLYIHAVEASKKPELGLKSANSLVKTDMELGHLVHMPSHIFIRTGKYHDGSLVNEMAVQYDSTYIASCKAQGVYPLAYFPHNYHFLAATATLEGRGETAINAAFKVAANADAQLMRAPEWSTLQHYYSIPYFVLVKFAQWDQILSMPQPEKDLKYPNAIWLYARGMAFLGKGESENAQKALDRLKIYAQDSSLKEVKIWENNSVSEIINIGSLVLEAELLNLNKKHTLALKLLYRAIEIEDNLVYQEPPDWFFSVRHSLGAMLLENNQIAEAEKIYTQDLAFFPDNGWALKGLEMCQEQSGHLELTREAKSKFEEAWKYADMEINSSRLLTNDHQQYENLNMAYLSSSTEAYLARITTCGKKY